MLCYLINDYLPAFGETLAIELGVAFLLGFRDQVAEPSVFASSKREFSESKRERISLRDYLKEKLENLKSSYEDYKIQSKKEGAMNAALKVAETPSQQMPGSELVVGILVLVLAGGVLGMVAVRLR